MSLGCFTICISCSYLMTVSFKGKTVWVFNSWTLIHYWEARWMVFLSLREVSLFLNDFTMCWWDVSVLKHWPFNMLTLSGLLIVRQFSGHLEDWFLLENYWFFIHFNNFHIYMDSFESFTCIILLSCSRISILFIYKRKLFFFRS